MSRQISWKFVWGAIAGILIGLYAITAWRIDVGYFNDDARYITAARTLLRGRYHNPEIPGAPIVLDRLPGFPLILSPFVALGSSPWAFLKLLSILFTIASATLLWYYYEQRWSLPQISALVFLFVLNPTVMKYSSSVMSESFFLLLVLGCFFFWNKSREAPTRRWPLVGLYLGSAAALLTRPEGMALVLALFSLFLLERRFKTGMVLMCTTLTPFLLFMNYSTGYQMQWHDIVAHATTHPADVFINVTHAMDIFLVDSVLQASLPVGHWMVKILWDIGVSGLALACMWRTLRRLSWKDPVVLYVLLSLGLHALFLSVNTRYYFPLIPFMLAWILQSSSKSLVWIVMTLSFFYLNPWTSPADKAWSSAHAYRRPAITLEWLQQRTKPDAYILATRASMVHLFTQRYAVSAVAAQDLEDLRYRLLQEHVTHILLDSNRLMILSGRQFLEMLAFWRSAEIWLPQWPAAYRHVFQNIEEGTQIWEVLPDVSFEKAYSLCLSADGDFAVKKWDSGISKLKQSLALYPNFPGALNRYGFAILQSGRSSELAKEKFKAALRLRPRFALAWVGLAMAYQKAGDPAMANSLILKAVESRADPSWSGRPETVQRLLEYSTHAKK